MVSQLTDKVAATSPVTTFSAASQAGRYSQIRTPPPAFLRQWEKNRRHVNEFALQKLRELCIDEGTRKLFGAEGQGEKEKNDPELEMLCSAAMDGINLIYEAAAAGHDAAREVLADLADKLTTRGGDWRRMKYLKKKD